MDDIGAKLKRLWKPKPKTFKGKGNVLGRGEQVKAFLIAAMYNMYLVLAV